MEVVIAHPNGWGIREQAFLRSAAVAAGFSTAEQAPSKVRFATEAEASVHFCIHHSNLGNVLQPGMNFAVCDAGGSTVDTTLYSVVSVRPVLKLAEKRASACVQAGAIFVDFEVEKFLRRTLTGAGLSSDDVMEYTKEGVKDFEGFAKRAFRDETAEHSISIAGARFNNTSIRIRRGRMTLSGSTIKAFFDVCVKEITASVDQQLADLNVPYILLVGGFGDSPYLHQEFRKRYEPRGSQVTTINDSTSKAVADGAVLWATAQGLLSRTLALSWGIETSVAFDPNNSDHQHRKEISSTSNGTMLPGRWKSLTKKDVPLNDGLAVVAIPFSLEFSSSSADLGKFELDLYSYSGNDEPMWMRNKQGNS
ncbi:unnamed protein product [Rhizoctonia solani]|uniref:Actin-like ATPase domain-containing protein n=1 Tax=Rhizoctonia solani TaxID=456999 RepID=A0A8H3HJD1_9AGAM|nr:unnamed protein product [Rhizoctonia solani]